MALKNKKSNFSEWYAEVMQKAELADHSAVSGCLIYRPFAYSVWEKIVSETDKRFKKIGIKNAYFPLLIPEKLLQKEATHLKGFTPEVAWVTHAGNSKLDERLAIRPTSETIMYDSYSKWIRSWRDLPLRINQWNNVVRWEFKHPTPFLRGREFLWNEGHTVFATEKEALAEKNQILGIYKEIVEDYLALPAIVARKTESEKFAGAEFTYAIEMLMPNGKFIQGPDFHHDGQKFSKVFNIQFLDKDGKNKYGWQNTWAITTRVLGILFAVHGDDKGVVLPPKIAPIQIAIIPIYDNDTKKKVLAEAEKLKNSLENEFSIYFDDRDIYTPGWKFNEWEIKGVPLRIEIGPRDIKARQVTIVRRDTCEKIVLRTNKINAKEVQKLLDKIQASLFAKARKFLESARVQASKYADLKNILAKGFAKTSWCGAEACETKVRTELDAKIYILDKKEKGKCVVCGKATKAAVYIAKSY